MNKISQRREQVRQLMKVALGEAPADLAIVNGDLVNVYTGELLLKQSVLVKGDTIAYVGPEADKGIGAATQIIAAAGKTIIPGLIDGHTHIACEYTISEFLKYVIPGGTTTIITETSETAFAAGYPGLLHFLRSIKHQPIKLLATLPPMVTLSPLSRQNAIPVAELTRLLRRPDVMGMGEPYWSPVVGGDERLLDLIIETRRAGKPAEGHSSGASERKLQAYIATGISSCHEPITAEEVLLRLRLGLFTFIREGEIRRELETVAPIKDAKIDFRQLALATDGVGPWQLTTDGYLDFVLQKAINLGFDPVTAIQMVTLNVARHFGLDNSIGGIAPGRSADILVLPNIKNIKPEYVISKGKIVARRGELLVPPRTIKYPYDMLHSVKLPREFTAGDFVIKAPGANHRVKMRVMDMATSLVTREALVDFAAANGEVSTEGAEDIARIAAIDRRHSPGRTFTALIRGTGLKAGAIASSATWDSSDIVVIGKDGADMAGAVNRLRSMNGGIVVYRNGRILAETALPIGGIISDKSMETLSRNLHAIQKAAESLGCRFPDVRITLAMMPSPAVAHLRICESGLFSLRENRFVDLMVG